jgi:nucleotidyltransferase substrate binding protein (TIGR01987 family)
LRLSRKHTRKISHELAWKTLKDYLIHQGFFEIHGSRDATRKAFELDIIENGEVWMDMILNRNRSSHTYNPETAEEIFILIQKEYFSEFSSFAEKMLEIKNAQ